MRAWQVRKHGEPRDALQIVDAPVPQVPPGLLRVRVATCGVGLPDLFMCRGSYALTPKLPFTPGQELVGEVTEAGEGAEMAVGQRVMAEASPQKPWRSTSSRSPCPTMSPTRPRRAS
jgi:NADPH2:quinone reductase